MCHAGGVLGFVVITNPVQSLSNAPLGPLLANRCERTVTGALVIPRVILTQRLPTNGGFDTLSAFLPRAGAVSRGATANSHRVAAFDKQ